MPFIEEQQTEGGLQPQNVTVQTHVGAGNFQTRDLWNDAMGTSNSVGLIANAAKYAAQEKDGYSHEVDPNFDPFKGDLITGYEDMADRFAGARNISEFNFIKTRIDEERQQDENLAAAGGVGVLMSLGAGILDPIAMIPVAGEGKAIYGLARAGRIGRAAILGAEGGLVYGAGFEAIAQPTRISRTGEDALINIGASTALGSVLGATGRGLIEGGNVFLRGQALHDMDGVAQAFAKGSQEYADNLAGRYGDSVGAARVPETTMAQETLVSAGGLERVGPFAQQDPTIRLANSESLAARKVVEKLADSPLVRVKNEEGIASPVPVDSLIRQHEARLELTGPKLFDLFSQYRMNRAAKFGDRVITNLRDLVRGAPEGKLTFSEFRSEVGKAMANGDKHAIPEVAQAAQLYRNTIFDPLKQRAIEEGLLPPDVKPETAASYISRLYNREKIVAQRPEFERRIANWLKSTNTNINERFDNFTKQAGIAKKVVDDNKPLLLDSHKQLAEIRPRHKEVKKQYQGLTREVAALEKQSKRTRLQAEKARARAESVTPEQTTAEFRRAVRDLKNGIPEKRQPMTLAEFVRSKGGIKDQGGEVSVLGGRKLKKDDPFGVISEKGRTLDEMALAAQEEGFFNGLEGGERITIDEFLQALEGDMAGRNPQYRLGDEEEIAHVEYIRQLADELDQRGIDYRKLKPEQIESALRDAEGKAGLADTSTNRARAREADYAARRAEKTAKLSEDELARRKERYTEISGERMTLDQRVRELEETIADLEHIVRTNEGKAERFGKLAEDVRFLASRSDGELQDIASDIVDGLIGIEPGRLPYQGVPVTRGPLKERTLTIPDSHIEEFLERDILRVARHYNHTMATDVELTRAFGSADMRDQLADIRNDFAGLRKEAAREYGVEDIGDKETKFFPTELSDRLQAIDKAERKAIRDVEGIRDRLRGTYGIPANPQALASRAFRVAKGVNFLRMMGGVTLSSIPDLARPVMVHGLMRTFGDGIAPLVRNFSQARLAMNEAKLAGTALDMITNDRALAMAGLDDAWASTSRLERGINALQDDYKFVSLIGPWTASLKQLSAIMSQTRSLQAIETLVKGGELAAKERTRLAQFGIDEQMARRMWKQVNQHGKKDSGIWWANTQAWTDREAVETYRSALQREVDKIIVTPGQDKPLFLSREMGGVIGQFKTFAFASTQRMLLSGLQQRDMAAMNGLLLSTVLGMMAAYAKTDDKRTKDWSAAKWVTEGLDRGGALAWTMDVNNTIEKISGGAIGVNPLLGNGSSDRYASRGAASALFGPTYGTVFDTLLPLMAAAANGQATQGDIHRLRQMLPYQNLFYIRGMLDTLEKNVGQSLGIPEKRQ